MQKNLIPPAITPHTPLQLRHRLTNTNPHTRRSANKHARPAAEVATQPLEQERDIRASVLGAPAVLFLDRCRQESEAHQVLLELGGRRGEAKVEALHLRRGAGVVYVWVYGARAGADGLRDVEGEVAVCAAGGDGVRGGGDGVGVCGVGGVGALVGWARRCEVAEVGLGEGGDVVFVLTTEFVFFLRVALGFVADEGGVALGGNG